ncbi:MAG: carboxypeptidase regulatory-like domain-containing protein [Planctomycetota bacterium]
MDEQGRPLAGISAVLRGRLGAGDERSNWVSLNGDVDWSPPESFETSEDGRFEVRFWPPPPYVFRLSLVAQQRVSLARNFFGIDSGTEMDFGDLVVPVGSQVRGQLVDAQGVRCLPSPDQAIEVRFGAVRERRAEDSGPPSQLFEPSRVVRTTVKPDGTFDLEERITKSAWKVEVSGIEPLSETMEVLVRESDESLDVPVRRQLPEDLIQGIVVDETGQPIPGVTIEPIPQTSGRGRLTLSNESGHFRLVRTALDQTNEVRLRARLEGFERTFTEETYEWGAQNVRLVLERGQSFRFFVTRASDGRPVEGFALRLAWRKDSPEDDRSLRSYSIRGGLEHEGGVLDLQGIRRGRYDVLVRPTDEGLGPASMLLEVDESSARDQRITVPERVFQPIRVVTTGGSPIVGSRVELIDSCSDEIRRATPTRDFQGATSRWSAGWLLGDAITDETGRVQLDAPAGTELVLRVSGEHETLLETPFVETGTEHVVALPMTGSLILRTTPASVVTKWTEQINVYTQASGRDFDPPHAFLRRVESRDEVFPPSFEDGDPVRLGAIDLAGACELRGIPPGEWRVFLRTGTPSLAGKLWTDDILGPRVTIEAGTTTEVSMDLSSERVGTLRATVEVYGASAAPNYLYLSRPDPDHPSESHRGRYVYPDGDDFVSELPSGAWTVKAFVTAGNDRFSVAMEEPVFISPGQVAERRVVVQLAEVTVRVSDLDGNPISGTVVRLRKTDGALAGTATTTDTDGRSTVIAPGGTYDVFVAVRSLSSEAAWRARLLEAARNRDQEPVQAAIDRGLTRVDSITIVPSGETSSFELRAGPDWDR